ncbi:MAG TPA: PsbP-related protein [Nitrososphaeraceae archaeon]|nr:PsbP-related protein [Nitrososphaeraceae archaeon]
MFKGENPEKRHKFIDPSSFVFLSVLLIFFLMTLNPSTLLHLSAHAQGFSTLGQGNFIVNNTGNTATSDTSSATNTSSSPSMDQTLSLQSFIGAGGSNLSNNNDSNINFLTYENPIYGISIEYPSAWTYLEQEEESSANTTIFSIVDIAPPISEDPNVATNFQMGIENLQSPISLDQYARTVINSYRGNLNFSLISVDLNSTLSGRPAYQIIFTDVTEDGIERKSIERGTVDEVNNRVYYVAFNTETSMYEKFLPIVQTMMNSLKLNTSSLSSMENLNSTTSLGNDSSSITDSMPLDDAIPFLNEQPSLPFSSSSSSMDIERFMESFTNSIFNGTSIFGGVGTSMVNGVKVSGISLDSNESRLLVTLSGTPTQLLGRNNTTSLTNDTTSTTTTTNAESLNSVTVIAMMIPINLADILSLAQASSSQGLDNDMMTEDMGFNEDSIFPSDSFNPFSLLSSMQIGSSSLTNADWSVPQTVTMNLVGGSNNYEQQQQYYSNNTSTTDLLFVSVIPYTGSDNNSVLP